MDLGPDALEMSNNVSVNANAIAAIIALSDAEIEEVIAAIQA